MKQNKMFSSMFVYIAIFTLMIFSVSAAQSAVNLGSASNFVILAKSGVSTTGTTSIIGDIGVSPIDSTGLTGFGLIMDSSNKFATSSLVTGKLYASDYTPPTPSTMTTAISDMQTAYTDAAGRTLPDKTELGAGDINGMTLTPGLYKWGTGVLISNGVTLSGGANDVWIFQIAQDLTVGNGAIITLSGGAQAKNVFWQVAGQASLGTTSNFKGNILSQTAVILSTGATLNGRALAQTAVTLDANAVTIPSGTATPTPNPTPTGSGSSGSGSSGSGSSGSGSSGSSGTSSSGSSSNLQCTEWSTCGSDGTQTETCTYPNSDTKLTRTQSCTPNQADTTIPTPKQDTNTLVTQKDNGQATVTTPSNNVVTQTGGTQTVHQNSWWENFLAWISGVFSGK